MKGFEEEAKIAHAALLDIEGKTEEAIATLESINNMSSVWHLAQVGGLTSLMAFITKYCIEFILIMIQTLILCPFIS